MCIKTIKDYSTDIKDILNLLDNSTLFISGWDKNPDILNINKKFIDEIVNQREHINTYIMSKDMQEIKEIISRNFIENNVTLEANQFTIVSNGTSAAFITILELIKKNVNKFLFLGPIYFTYYHLLKIFEKQMFYWNVNLFDEQTININKFCASITKDIVDCVIITVPFFGSGVSLDFSEIQKLIKYCNNNKIYFIIDYVYGNMEWYSNNSTHNYNLIKEVTSSKYSILYESIPKRLFLNGIKNAIIYSHPDLINDINCDSEICQGSISYIQESMINVIYKESFNQLMIKSISEAVEYAHNNYEILKTLLHDTCILLAPSNSGYFTLVGIPLKYFKHSQDYDIVKELKKECGIVVIPHSRYYYNHSGYFCFRINLSLDITVLIDSIKKILEFCYNIRK